VKAGYNFTNSTKPLVHFFKQNPLRHLTAFRFWFKANVGEVILKRITRKHKILLQTVSLEQGISGSRAHGISFGADISAKKHF
jgi:hypothetical protein